jgi:transcriptional antiterminator RfaH
LASQWYVLACKPNKEEIVFRQLQSRGYEVFYPRFFSANGKSGRLYMRSYFPGYLFIRLDLEKVGVSTFQWMPNTDGLVCFGMKPAFVPDSLVQAIKRHVSSINSPAQGSTLADTNIYSGVSQSDRQDDNYRAIFNSNLTSDERVGELLRMLQGLSVAPNGDQSLQV